MDHDRALSASRSSAGPAAIAVSPEHLFPQTAEIFLILPLERVTGGAHAQGEDFPPPATAVECPLSTCPDLLHFPLPFPLRKSISLPRRTPGRTVSTNPSSTSRARGCRKAARLRIAVPCLPGQLDTSEVLRKCSDEKGEPLPLPFHAFSASTIGRGRSVIAMGPSFAISKRARSSTCFPTGSQRRWLHG